MKIVLHVFSFSFTGPRAIGELLMLKTGKNNATDKKYSQGNPKTFVSYVPG